MADEVETIDPPKEDESSAVDFENLVITETEPLIKGTPDPKKSTKAAKPPKDKPKTRRTAPPYRPGQFVKPLTEFYGMIAMGVAIKDPQCAQAIMANAQSCAEAWDKAAKTNTAVRAALQALIETTTWGTLVAAHMPIVMAMLVHHRPNMIPTMFTPTVEDAEVNSRDESAA